MSPYGNKSEDMIAHASEVRSGEYFESARKWYRLLYEMPVIERSMAILIAFVCFSTAIISLMTLSSLYPLSQDKPVFVRNDAIGIEIPNLRHIKKAPNEQISLSVARIILERYLEARENFTFSRADLAEQDRVIYQHSAPTIFQGYRQWLQPNNPSSPVNTLGTVWTRKVKNIQPSVDIFSSNENGMLHGKATITFINHLRGTKGNRDIPGNATIEFSMPALAQEPEGIRVLQYNRSSQRYEFLKDAIIFQVTSYSSSNLSAGAPQ